MKRQLMSAAMAVVLAAGMVGSAFADAIGYVDFEKVMQDYDRAQSFLADTKVREAELRKLQADYVKQIEQSKKNSPKNPVASSQLEKDLSSQLTVRVQEYRDWATNQQKSIDESLQLAVKDSAKMKQVDVVLSRQAIFEGGVDLTSDVLARLNTK